MQGQTWFDEITTTVCPATAPENLLTPMVAHRQNPQAHGYRSSFQPEYFLSIVSMGKHVYCLNTSLSKDSNQGIKYE